MLLGVTASGVMATAPPSTATERWLNKTVVQAPRNGTNTHTVNFTPATGGNLLIATLAGPITSAMQTSGWVKHTRGVDQTEVALFTKYAAAGESQFTVTHNSNDRPLNGIILEFPSTYTLQVARPLNSGGLVNDANPIISPLGGAPWCFALNSGVIGAGTTSGTVTFDWASPVVDEDLLVQYGNGSTEGGALAFGYEPNVVASSWTAGIASTVGFAAASQRLSFSVRNSGGLAYAWQSGEAPIATSEVAGYEFGTCFIVNKPIAIERVRAWSGSTENFPGRIARLWVSDASFASGTVVATGDLPDAMSGLGPEDYPLTYAVTSVPAYLCISFPPSLNWYAAMEAMIDPRIAADGAITLPAAAGRFNGTPGQFPTNAFGNRFYGVDVGYRRT